MSYSVSPYQDRYQADVVRMLGAFWNYHAELAKLFFDWKYLNNPFSNKINIALLLSDSQVVGMRGAGILSLRVQGTKQLAACVGDSWIDSNHRGKNQFGRLSECLEQTAFNNHCRLILNMSASDKVRKSSLKNGWNQVAKSETLTAVKPDSESFSKNFKHFDQQFIHPQTFEGGILVSSNQLFVEPVVNLQKNVPVSDSIDIDRTTDYLHWRYLRPGVNYRFLYLFEKIAGENRGLPPLRSFVSLCTPSQIQPGHVWVSDYLCMDLHVMAPLLHMLIQKLDFRSINIQDTEELAPLRESLTQSGYKIDVSKANPQYVLERYRRFEERLDTGRQAHAKTCSLKGFCHRAINLDSA
ncbi:MAG: hypothetical protein KTR18_10115 [Acidiferrobacterales bacterium]|nr:hypothetical protein [Acidiferrobacterales bacterium]